MNFFNILGRNSALGACFMLLAITIGDRALAQSERQHFGSLSEYAQYREEQKFQVLHQYIAPYQNDDQIRAELKSSMIAYLEQLIKATLVTAQESKAILDRIHQFEIIPTDQEERMFLGIQLLLPRNSINRSRYTDFAWAFQGKPSEAILKLSEELDAQILP